MIVDKTTDQKVRRNFRLAAPLPMLISSAAELKKLNTISDTFENSTKSMFYAYLVINFLFSFAMGMLWGTFQTLQVIIAMPLLAVKMPPNVIIVFKGFSDIVNMKIIDPKQLYGGIM